MPILDIGEFLYRVEKNKNYNKILLGIVLPFQIIKQLTSNLNTVDKDHN